jgi:AcrR family transcriptional regulator
MFNINDTFMNDVQVLSQRRPEKMKPLPKPAGERREQLKTALVDAAEAIIANDGLAALRARDLAAAAGCALGAIYNAFDDLDAIVFAVNMRTLALLDRELGEALRHKPAAGRANADDPDLGRLIRLALAYIVFAEKNGPRWRALFEHRLRDDQRAPPWYIAEQNRIFQLVEAPLHAIRPDLAAGDLAQLARTVFSAVHGVISLGLEQKLGEIPPRRLREQAAAIVTAIARGLRKDMDAPG